MIFILSYLELYGFDIDDYEETNVEPITIPKGYCFELTQKKANICPFCKSHNIYVHDHKIRSIKIRHKDDVYIYFVIRLTRCKCVSCKKTFTRKLNGIRRHAVFPDFTIDKIKNSFKKMLTFKAIANENDMTKNHVMQIFDETYPNVDSLKLPRVMCLDEIKFFTDIETKYITVISNFETGDIVDILPARTYDVLKGYFASRYDEIKNVQYIVTDMYEAFNRLHLSLFPKAIHIIDLFHVIEDLTRAVNKIRVDVMDTLPDSGEKNFMKNNWRLFLKQEKKIDYRVWNKEYCHEESNVQLSYFDWFHRCLGKSNVLYNAHNCLQEMYKYKQFSTYKEGEQHLNRIINLLNATNNKELIRVANTYEKNKVGIVNCLDKKSRGFRYTTGIAECINNHIKTIIKMCYGCLNYERFRKRVLIISRSNKMNRSIKK